MILKNFFLIINHWLIKVNSFGCLEPGCELTPTQNIRTNKYSISVSPTVVQRDASIFIKSESTEEVKDVTIMFYTLNGELMKAEDILLSNSKNRIGVGNWSAGSYILVVSDEGKVIQTEKIIVVE